MTDLAAAWTTLEAAAQSARERRIADLFKSEPDRLDRLSVEAPELLLDLSKQPWSLAEADAALALARAGEIEAARDSQFAGQAVNPSEDRAALHMALRAPKGAAFQAKGEGVSAEVDATREAMAAIARAVRSGEKRGATGQAFSAIVHIGIGGSDFGPRLVWEALRPL